MCTKKTVQNLVSIKRAMISVSDKSHLGVLINGLIRYCPEIMIYSSGGTFKAISEILKEKSQKHLMEVSEYTGVPETEGGRVKTLHHKLFLGYLTETSSEAHQRDLERENAVPIDLVVVGLYPFENVTSERNVTAEKAIENIDVGGPSALRAAAKNWHRVMTISKTDLSKYYFLLEALEKNGEGCTDLEMRYAAFKETFFRLSSYDASIEKHFHPLDFEVVKKEYEIV